MAGAIKDGTAESSDAEAATASMLRMNDHALEIGRRYGVLACTDVTGFGLLGHLRNILQGSDLTATIHANALPILPGAEALARADKVPAGTRSNLSFLTPQLVVASDVDPVYALIAADAQTSGGLLLCLDADVAAQAVADLEADGHHAADLGVLEAPSADAPVGHITLRT